MAKSLLERVRSFLANTGMTATQFGLAAANNSSLVVRLENGNVTARTLAKVEAYLASAAKRRKRNKARRLSAKT